MDKPVVVVMMSTYNGERHLVEQIESILNQEGVDVRLMIRDDGSNDKTVEIARKYTDDVVVGDNIGFRYSFLELIKNAPEAEYYALADQDDIWLPEKLKWAVDSMEGTDTNIPVLYASSRKNYVNGKIEEASELHEYKQTTFNGFDNVYHLQGCTMVFNYKLKSLLSEYFPKKLITCHDVWIHQLCKALDGYIIYDKRPSILYRLECNTIGVPRYPVINRIKSLFINESQDSDIENLVRNIYEGFEKNIPLDNKRVCLELMNYRRNVIQVLFNPIYYQGRFAINLYRFFSFLLKKA